MLFVPERNKPVNSKPLSSRGPARPGRLSIPRLLFFSPHCRGRLSSFPLKKKTRAVILCALAILFYPAFTGDDAFSLSPGYREAGPRETGARKPDPVKKGASTEPPCLPPCTNTARAPFITPAEVVPGRTLLECASVHFGGFIPGYGGFEIFGVGRDDCPVVETYVPSHFNSVPAPCRDCQWQDGATIRERENSCSQQLNFVFIAMPNCVRGDWVNTSERVRTCSRELSCHRPAGAGRSPGKGRR